MQHLATIPERSIENTETLSETRQDLSDEDENPTSYSENLRGFY